MSTSIMVAMSTKKGGVMAFQEALLRKKDELDLKYRQVSEKSGYSHAQINNVLIGKAELHERFCINVSRAFFINPIRGLLLAGFITVEEVKSFLKEEVDQIYN